MTVLTKLGAFISLSILLAGCSGDEPVQGPAVKYETVPTFDLSRSEASSNDGLNSFGMKFFNEVSKSDNPLIGHNFSISPTSMSLCVSMIANACDKSTEQSIVDLMDCENLEDVNSLSKKIMQFLPDKINKSVLSLANSVWHSTDYLPSDDFRTRMANYYFSDVVGVDFSSPDAVVRLNDWCRENTNGLINKAFDTLYDNTIIVCINTLYFMCEWSNHFDAKQTRKQIFHGVVEDADVDMMHGDFNLRYCESENWESVIIPYEGSNNMIVFMPKDGTTIKDLSASISDDDVKAAAENTELAFVKLSMPKFSVQSGADFTEELQRLGVHCYPNNLKGFSGFVSPQPIGQAIRFMQKTSISTDEIGTVAAAVSSANDMLTSNCPTKTIDFTLDRPFIYLIRNTKTGSIIMMGQYTQP